MGFEKVTVALLDMSKGKHQSYSGNCKSTPKGKAYSLQGNNRINGSDCHPILYAIGRMGPSLTV